MISYQLRRGGCQQIKRIQYKYFIGAGVKRQFAAQADLKLNHEPDVEATTNISWESARPYEQIPGPTKFSIIKGFLRGGKYYGKSQIDVILELEKIYGSIMRLPGILGRPEMIISLNPNDYATVFRNEGHWPSRRNFDTFNYYRDVHRRDFFEGSNGVLTTSGEKWAKARTAVNPVLMQPKNAVLYLNNLLSVKDEFLMRIREIRDPITQEMPDTFEDDINRTTLESVAAVALNKELGLIRKNRDDEESKTIMRSIRKFFQLIYELEVKPSLWKYISTPKFRELMRTMDIMTNICSKYINEALAKIEHDNAGKLTSEVGNEKSVLEKLVRIDKNLAVVMALDMMMAGVDTTSSTIVGILFCIAKNPEKQQKLFEELKTILPSKNSKLTIENMRNLPYLRACIKEGMRVYPIFPGTMRTTPTDIVLGGYRVPAGTEISIVSNILMNDARFVPKAKEFLPERWLRDEDGQQLVGKLENPFLYLPFGFGPRSCVGKRIVNLEMEIIIASLVRNFHIEFNYSLDNAFKTTFISVPAIPLNYKFAERKN